MFLNAYKIKAFLYFQKVSANHTVCRDFLFFSSIILFHALPSISSLTSSNRNEITWLAESRPMVMP